MATLSAIMAALADQLRDEVDPETNAIQVEPRLVINPTPPSIDIYPADPFQNRIAMGVVSNEIRLIVRARINTPDDDMAQDVLLALMDPTGNGSVALAVEGDKTLGSTVQDAVVSEGPSQFGVFADAGGNGAYLGCTWTVTVTP